MVLQGHCFEANFGNSSFVMSDNIMKIENPMDGLIGPLWMIFVQI